jgi:uncharacterized protein (DUF58 family)
VVVPSRVAAGQEARVQLSVTNPRRWPSPTVEARDRFDSGRRWARFAIAPLRTGQTRTGNYRLPSARRGVYRLGPLELWMTDPLGLAVRSRSTAADTTLVVHPEWEFVPLRSAGARRPDAHRDFRSGPGREGSEFHALREYVPGDDLRRVHWPSTARLDDLVIRQPERTSSGRLAVAVDLRAEVHDATSLERVISATASLCLSALRDGIELRLLTSGGWDSARLGSPIGATPALDTLAAASTHPGRRDHRVFPAPEPGEALVVVTTDRATAADLPQRRTGGPVGPTVVAFTTDPDPEPGAGHRAPIRGAVQVRPGESFGRAWKREEMLV